MEYDKIAPKGELSVAVALWKCGRAGKLAIDTDLYTCMSSKKVSKLSGMLLWNSLS